MKIERIVFLMIMFGVLGAWLSYLNPLTIGNAWTWGFGIGIIFGMLTGIGFDYMDYLNQSSVMVWNCR